MVLPMDAHSLSISTFVRRELINLDEVTRFSPNRRFETIYSVGSPPESLYFLESGLVKIHKRGEANKHIVLQIVSEGELFGEDALGLEPSRCVAAEILREGVIYVIPRDLFIRVCDDQPILWREITCLLAARKRQLEKKIELLYLLDVEYRILYYMADLARIFSARSRGPEYSIPLSRSELASLIGATRETTSTILNVLARRGLVRLGRRQLIVPSIDGVLEAANQRIKVATAS